MAQDFKVGIHISLRALSKTLGEGHPIDFSSVPHDQKLTSADYMQFRIMTVGNYRMLAVQKYFFCAVTYSMIPGSSKVTNY